MLMIFKTESQVCYDIRDAHLECCLSHDELREWLSPDLDLLLRAAVFLPVLLPFPISRVLPLRITLSTLNPHHRGRSPLLELLPLV